MINIRKEKNSLREKYLRKRRELPSEYKSKLDALLCKKFLETFTYRSAHTLLVYYPLSDEADITQIALKALADNKTVAYPRCTGDSVMEFYLVSDPSQLESGSYGIMEPCKDLPLYDPKRSHTERTICLVPGLLYDSCGYRLGYGRGYYDRYLPLLEATKVGVTYSSFIVKDLPRGRYDTTVDFMICEKGVVLTNEN